MPAKGRVLWAAKQSAACDYDALVATVKARGILEPIRMRETPAGDHIVTVGHRCYAAAVDAARMELSRVVPRATPCSLGCATFRPAQCQPRRAS